MKKSIFLFFAAILCATSTWAGVSGGDVYFDPYSSGWGNVSSIEYVISHDGYSRWYKMSNISNTQLYYIASDSWSDAKYIAFTANFGWTSGESNKYENRLNYAPSGGKYTKKNSYGVNSGSTYLFYASSSSNNATIQTSSPAGYLSSGYTALNYKQTVKQELSIDEGNTFSASTEAIASVKVSSYKLTQKSTATADSKTISSGSSSANCEAARTATVTYTVSNINSDYTFVGWYDGNTKKSTNTTYTYQATEAKTITARFSKEPKHPVTVSYKCGSTDVKLSETLEVGEFSAQTVTAEKIKDYTFSGWILGSGIKSADETANPISITTKTSGEYTLTANYEYIEPVIKTIYCKMEHDWWYSDGAAISAYVWGDEEGEWKSAPGTLMALAPWETKVWKIDIDVARYPKVCFIRVKGDGSENWGAQTKDLEIPTDEKNLFTISNTNATWASSSKCDGAWSVYTPAVAPDRYLTGNAAGFGMTIDGEGNEQWSPNTIKMTWNDATQKFTHTVSGLEANKYYKFRITDGTWGGKWGYSNLNPKVENVFEAEDNNISFVLSAAGSITVAFDGTNIELTTSSSFAAPVYTIVGDELLMGTHWDLNSVENQMKHSSGNLYTLEKNVRIPAGEYEYKAVRNYSYDWEVPNNGGKNKVTIEKSGEGTIIYTLDIANYTLKHEIQNWEEKDISNTVELFGIGENKTFIEAADRKTTSLEVALEANSVYSFEIIVNSVYMKNNGVMWRGNCEDWTFTLDGSRAHIITDLAGTYTFTWTYDGNKLSVKYPDGTNVPVPVFLAGGMNSWDRLATRLIPSADGKTASAKVELERNVYNEFRMVIGTEDWTNTGTMDRGNCRGWTFDKVTENNKDVNAGIIPDVTGEYTFTWSYTDNELSVTYPEQTCTECSNWYLCGDFNSWKLTDEFMQVEPKVVRAVVALEAGEEYKFKIQDMTNPRDGKWWGCKETINRASEELALEQQSGSEYNCTIVADLAGDYTFTWNTDTKKLTVTYPEIIIGDGDNSNVLNSLNGKTVDLTVTRSFASGKLYTLVLPFAMDNSTVINVFGANVELYDFTSLSENTSGELILSFTKQSTPEIAAGTPYLIKPETDANGFDLTGVTINTTTTPVPQTDGTTIITMQPVLSATAEAKTNGTSQYWLAADNNLYNNVVSIKGLRVIFDVQTTKANVRARAAFNENVETGLDNNQLPISNIQKLIENGQLIIIREGVKYNVQGQKL